jgi:Delta3-Delta2-enoyl-CoA isomerase
MSLTIAQVFEKVKADGNKPLAYVFDAPIHYVVFNEKDFTFDNDRVEEYLALLNKIDKTEGEGVMITISTSPKIFSTGFNLPFWAADVTHPLLSVALFLSVLEKLATMSLPCMAVVNGHAYAGGMILSILHDFRIMKAERTRMCLSEANVNSTLPTAYSVVCTEKLGIPVYQKLQYGIAIDAKECLHDRIVDSLYTSDDERDKQIATFVKKYAQYGKNRAITTENKEKINKQIIKACRGPILTSNETFRTIGNIQKL